MEMTVKEWKGEGNKNKYIKCLVHEVVKGIIGKNKVRKENR